MKKYEITEDDLKALKAIAEGSVVKTEIGGNFIMVENPDFAEDNGESPYLVISTWRIAGYDDLGERST
jgi:hypothetical protein